ncbi:MAG: ABC transporter ATP-binding protein [Desulfobacterales bacterium]|nr:MAG: ABC transporter ATP-binding protein [Desulfobacterales bacterium]
MLTLENVVVHYGGVKALKGISLKAQEGAITCLIGANGAGKSTTLRAISGMVPLTSGEIWFQGRRIDGMEPEEIVEMGIGHVPEGKKLFLEMTVRDNLLTGAHLRHDKESIERDLQRVYGYFPVLGSARNKPASKMSGGEQQMIAIGRGLMGSPKLLLLDEPSLGLSPILTREVGFIIKRIAEERVSILLIEQNANLALQLAHKCYVLETGSIALEGTSKDLQDNEHVKAAYLGISCTWDGSRPAAPRPRVKTEDAPAAKSDRTGDRRWQDARTPVLKPESRASESQTWGSRTSELLGKEFDWPDKLRSDCRLPEISTLKNAVHGITAPDRSILDLGRPSETRTDRFTVSNRVSGNERPARVVKKVFTPKKR